MLFFHIGQRPRTYRFRGKRTAAVGGWVRRDG